MQAARKAGRCSGHSTSRRWGAALHVLQKCGRQQPGVHRPCQAVGKNPQLSARRSGAASQMDSHLRQSVGTEFACSASPWRMLSTTRRHRRRARWSNANLYDSSLVGVPAHSYRPATFLWRRCSTSRWRASSVRCAHFLAGSRSVFLRAASARCRSMDSSSRSAGYQPSSAASSARRRLSGSLVGATRRPRRHASSGPSRSSRPARTQT